MEHLEKFIESTQQLYKACVRDLSKELNDNRKLVSATQKGGDILLDNNEKVQIQITITRNTDDWLGDFETSTIENYTQQSNP